MKSEHKSFFLDLSETELLARCIWGEARGEPLKGQVAIANVVINRVKNAAKWDGADIKSVILCPWQFESFSELAPFFPRLLQPEMRGEAIELCRVIAELAIAGALKDVTNGATHFHSVHMHTAPRWARKLEFKTRIGNHLFYKEE